MDDQTSKEKVLNKTLYVLVRLVGLTPQEVSQLRLSDLHLAGKTPNLNVPVEGDDKPKKVDLDLEAHRALVGWLVNRPDSVGDFLFPGHGAEPMAPAEIQHAVTVAGQTEPDLPQKPAEAKKEEAPESPLPEPAEDSPPPESSPGDETMVSPHRPEKPLPARPAPTTPPPSAPEAGLPPRTPGATGPQPPTRAPEGGRPLGAPPSGPPAQQFPAQSFPPAGEQPGPSADQEAAESFPRPVRKGPTAAPKPVKESKPRVPPQPVRGKGADQTPVIMKRKEPEQPPQPIHKETPPPTPVDETPAPPTPEKTRSPGQGQEQVPPPSPEKGKESVSTPAGPAQAKAAPKPAQPAKREPGDIPPPPQIKEGANRPAIFSFAIGGLLVVVALCVICAGGTGWFAVQEEARQDLLVSLGLAEAELAQEPPPDAEATETALAQQVQTTPAFESPLATPTLPPTSTPTPLPPTNTPLPTDTATPVPPTQPPTDTPVPTDTPAPTNTPTPQPPAATPTPEESPTPAEPAAPAFKYDAPVLLEPADGFEFIAGNTIVLRWQPVDLAPDEQYAVRLKYRFHGEITYQGSNIKESEWTVPLSLFGQVDPPDNRYEWYVQIERLNEDGSGTAISPESEHRTFTWK